jgi:hypothetical protein
MTVFKKKDTQASDDVPWQSLAAYPLSGASCFLLPASCFLLPASCFLLPASCFLLPALYPSTVYVLTGVMQSNRRRGRNVHPRRMDQLVP